MPCSIFCAPFFKSSRKFLSSTLMGAARDMEEQDKAAMARIEKRISASRLRNRKKGEKGDILGEYCS